MAIVTILPSGFTVEVGPWDHLMKAAHEQGLRWPNMCGGGGLCRKCTLSIIEGAEHVCRPTAFEVQGLATIAYKYENEPQPIRLACLLRTDTDLVVKKDGVVRAPVPETG